MWAFHTQSCHLKKWALNTSRLYVSCNSLSDFLGIWGYLRYLYTYIIIYIYIYTVYIYIYILLFGHVFSHFFFKDPLLIWTIHSRLLGHVGSHDLSDKNPNQRLHLWSLLLVAVVFIWLVVIICFFPNSIACLWFGTFLYFSISFIQRHYQIEYFPVFGDRRFCGWNLVCSWEYSICLRWVAKCWFRVCIYIYTKSLIFWAYKLWKYISKSTWF